MSTRRLFGDIIDAASSISDEDGLAEAVARIAARYEFGRFAYLRLHAATARSFAISNYPPEWQSIYFGRSYMVVDPVVTIGKRLMRAFQWSVEQQRKSATRDQRRFWDGASDFGIHSGLTIPIRVAHGQTAMLTFAATEGQRMPPYCETDASLAATAVAFLHDRLGRAKNPTTVREPGLTDREALCMRWAAEGKSMHDIALITGLTFHTVRWDLDNVRAKLNVRNLKEALAVASAMRLF